MPHRINFSGHPVAWAEFNPLVGVNLPVDDAGRLAEAILSVLDALPCRAELERGEAAEVVLPGAAGAIGVLLALWHGRFGSFPTIRWALRGPDGSFGWPDAARVDLQDLRCGSRTSRG